MSISDSARKRIKWRKPSSARNNTKRVWYETKDLKIVHVTLRDEDTKEWKEESFRIINKDGSAGWEYQKKRDIKKGALDEFLKLHNIPKRKVLKSKDQGDRLYQWTTFVAVDDLELVQGPDGVYVEAELYIPALEDTVIVRGGVGVNETVAKRRLFSYFNRIYPGCHIEMPD